MQLSFKSGLLLFKKIIMVVISTGLKAVSVQGWFGLFVCNSEQCENQLKGTPRRPWDFTLETRSASFSAASRCRWRRWSVKQRSPDVSVFGSFLRLLQGRPDRLLSITDRLETHCTLLCENIAALVFKVEFCQNSNFCHTWRSPWCNFPTHRTHLKYCSLLVMIDSWCASLPCIFGISFV